MATYGKKKKGMFSGFSMFQDERHQSQENTHLGYTRLERAKANTKTYRRGEHEDDSMDELANTALLGRQSEDMPRHSSLSSAPRAGLPRSKSTFAIPGMLGKPLPPLPSIHPADALGQQQNNNQILDSKPKSSKAIHKGLKKSGRPTISNPILQTPDHDSDTSMFTGFQGVHRPQDPTQPHPSTIDAAALGRTISDLMQQAAAEKNLNTPKRKETAKKDKTPRPSPLQRSKQAFIKASRAISDRLSSSGDSSHGRGRKLRSRVKRTISLTPSPPPEEMSSYRRLHRLMTEGENLNNPKIQSLVGDGHIPRKPLPVYESMKSRPSSPPLVLMNDVSADLTEIDAAINHEDFDFDFGFSRSVSHIDSTDGVLPFPNHIDAHNWPIQSSPVDANYSTIDTHRSPTQSSVTDFIPITRFSDRIPGLEQHPDVLAFTSCPSDYVMPVTRWEPQPIHSHHNDPTSTSSQKSSFVLPDPEASTDDNLSFVLSHSRRSTYSSVSVKRKSATEDLRAEVDPAQKRPKRSSLGMDPPREDSFLASEIGRLDTEERPVLARKDTNIMYARSDMDDIMSTRATRRGLGMFDTGKCKEQMPNEPMTETVDMLWLPQGRSTRLRRSSVPRPKGAIYNRGSWGQTQLIDLGEDDSMDIDELQNNDLTYQMGTNMS